MYIHTAVHATKGMEKLCIPNFPHGSGKLNFQTLKGPFILSFCLCVGTKKKRIKSDKNKKRKGERKKKSQEGNKA